MSRTDDPNTRDKSTIRQHGVRAVKTGNAGWIHPECRTDVETTYTAMFASAPQDLIDTCSRCDRPLSEIPAPK